MQIYLPIAEMPVNIFLILFLGLATGFLAGMFGIGGGFLATPFLIFIGIPSSVAVATSTNQIISASISGLLVHLRKGAVDIRIGGLLIFGGFIGSLLGVIIFRMLENIGQIDISIALIYVIFLGAIGIAMASDSFKAVLEKKYNISWSKKSKSKLLWLINKIEKLPCKSFFPKSEITISIFVPIAISIGIGILVSLIGIGGGFLMIPAMLYILKMPSSLVVGTSLFQIVFIASNATLLQAITNHNVDIILSSLMIFSSAIGAQFGTRVGYKMDADVMRSFLAILLILICTKMLFSLFSEPQDLYKVEVLK
jgi:uncharacterized membrane protein YfcA